MQKHKQRPASGHQPARTKTMPQPKDDEDLRRAAGVGSGPTPHPPAAAPAKAPDEPKPPEEKALPADEARALLGAGHRLRKAADPPTKWITQTRVNNETCLAQPLADVDPKAFEGLVVIPPPYN